MTANTTTQTVKDTDVTCPSCGATPTEHCVAESGKKARRTHADRLVAAREAREDLAAYSAAVAETPMAEDVTETTVTERLGDPDQYLQPVPEQDPDASNHTHAADCTCPTCQMTPEELEEIARQEQEEFEQLGGETVAHDVDTDQLPQCDKTCHKGEVLMVCTKLAHKGAHDWTPASDPELPKAWPTARTLDGVVVVPGLVVIDYDMRVGTVSAEQWHIASDGTPWFRVDPQNKDFDGGRMWVADPMTGETAIEKLARITPDTHPSTATPGAKSRASKSKKEQGKARAATPASPATPKGTKDTTPAPRVPQKPEKPGGWDKACPKCKATKGDPCTVANGSPTHHVHSARAKA